MKIFCHKMRNTRNLNQMFRKLVHHSATICQSFRDLFHFQKTIQLLTKIFKKKSCNFPFFLLSFSYHFALWFSILLHLPHHLVPPHSSAPWHCSHVHTIYSRQRCWVHVPKVHKNSSFTYKAQLMMEGVSHHFNSYLQ